jgi:hypothetical protein
MATLEQLMQAVTQLSVQVNTQSATITDLQQRLLQADARTANLESDLTTNQARLSAAQEAATQAQQAATAAQVAVSMNSTTTAPAAAAPGMGMGNKDLSKSVRAPKLLKCKEDWETFKFQFGNWIGTMDSEVPKLLEEAEKRTTPINPAVDLNATDRQRSIIVYGILVSYLEEKTTGFNIVRKVKDRNGFEGWRLLSVEMATESWNKNYEWLRALNAPTFPKKEADLASALQD